MLSIHANTGGSAIAACKRKCIWIGLEANESMAKSIPHYVSTTLSAVAGDYKFYNGLFESMIMIL